MVSCNLPLIGIFLWYHLPYLFLKGAMHLAEASVEAHLSIDSENEWNRKDINEKIRQ
jgi:hypothetical protein